MKFKVDIPPNNETSEEAEAKCRAFFKEKDLLYSKTLIFINNFAPTTITELKEEMESKFHQEIDKALVWRIMKSFHMRGIINEVNVGYVLTRPTPNKIFIEIKRKHYEWIEKIPSQFRKKFNNVKYYWISDQGKKQIPWVCKLLGYKYKEEEEKDERIEENDTHN